MIIKTRAIVLNYIKFRETSIIVRMYTENYGMQSFIVNGVRSSKSKKSMGQYHCLSLLDIVSYYAEHKDLHQLSDSRIAQSTKLTLDIRKSTISIFLSEILSKLMIHERNENPALFEFVWGSICELDEITGGIELFHLKFLLQLSFYFGIDVRESSIISELAKGDKKLEDFLLWLSDAKYNDQVNTNHHLRNQALRSLMDIYKNETESINQIKSLEVLRQIFA